MKFCRKLALATVALLATSAFAADLAQLRNGFSIRHERREIINNLTRLYLSSDSNSSYIDVPTEEIACFEKDDSPATAAPVAQKAPDMKQLVSDAGTRHRVDPDLIESVIRAESGFNPKAVSPKGAQGLMQLMPGTAAKLGVNEPFDPKANIDAGTAYLDHLLTRYNDDMVKALAAYNAGPHRVEQYHGVPPYRETHAYVARIVRDFNRKKLAQQKTQPSSVPRKAHSAVAVSRTQPGN